MADSTGGCNSLLESFAIRLAPARPRDHRLSGPSELTIPDFFYDQIRYDLHS